MPRRRPRGTLGLRFQTEIKVMSLIQRSHRCPRPVAAILLVAALLPLVASASDAAEPGAARKGELLHLLRHDCGACHGMRLTGGLGPSLLPTVLRDKPADGLARTILDGRPGTPMPPWKNFLSESEARWIVESLIKGIPDAN